MDAGTAGGSGAEFGGAEDASTRGDEHENDAEAKQ
jgi:hypothetical protein